MTGLLRKYLGKDVTAIPWAREMAARWNQNIEELTVGDVLAMTSIYHAARGNAMMLKEILERVDGRVTSRVEVGGPLLGLNITEEVARQILMELDDDEEGAAPLALPGKKGESDGD